ncbi:MAG: 30S ribosome-binding factor RbfA, partial [Clostridia bacterium]|nr:30S ribosome-binding factor RbfA [Clostridia bacterium]
SDASFAKVYVSDLKGIEGAKEAVQGLTAATGLIRREVGHRLHLRKTPEIRFIADDSVEQGVALFKKLDAAEGRGTDDED